MKRGQVAVGHIVNQNAWGDDATGFGQLSLSLASWQSVKQESPVETLRRFNGGSVNYYS